MRTLLKSHNTKYLLLFSAFSVILLGIRIYFAPDYTFLFLAKNLALAWVPFLISQVFRLQLNSKVKFFGVVFCWLLFFPNTIYMLTDLFQLWQRHYISLWYDLILILSFGFTALFLGLGSLKSFEKEVLIRNNIKYVNIYTFLVIYLGSIGVYLGRFVRLNSSDIFLNPRHLIDNVIAVFAKPFAEVDFYWTTLVFAVFIYFLYYGIFNFAKNHE